MSGYLVDTNHLSAMLTEGSPVDMRVLAARRQGHRPVTCTPVLCELAVGIEQSERKTENWKRLGLMLRVIRVWPLEPAIARVYAEVHAALRAKGRVLSAVDIMLAALARRTRLTILTTDRDFEALPDIPKESWAAPR